VRSRCAPGEDAEISGGMEGEGKQIEVTRTLARFFAVSKVVFEMYPLVLSTLKVVSIFHRARPQRQVRRRCPRDGKIGDEAVVVCVFPWREVSMENQLT